MRLLYEHERKYIYDHDNEYVPLEDTDIVSDGIYLTDRIEIRYSENNDFLIEPSEYRGSHPWWYL